MKEAKTIVVKVLKGYARHVLDFLFFKPQNVFETSKNAISLKRYFVPEMFIKNYKELSTASVEQ